MHSFAARGYGLPVVGALLADVNVALFALVAARPREQGTWAPGRYDDFYFSY